MQKEIVIFFWCKHKRCPCIQKIPCVMQIFIPDWIDYLQRQMDRRTHAELNPNQPMPRNLTTFPSWLYIDPLLVVSEPSPVLCVAAAAACTENNRTKNTQENFVVNHICRLALNRTNAASVPAAPCKIVKSERVTVR